MNAKIVYNKNKQMTLTLTDDTTGASFTTSKSGNSYKRTSAEWITEAPSSSSGILPLANFGTTYFSASSTDNFIPTHAKQPLVNRQPILVVSAIMSMRSQW